VKAALESIVVSAPAQIGTLREKPLHASLKQWYSRPSDLVEERVDGYVIDLVRGDLLIEVQTRGFSSIKRKLGALLDLGHRVRILHPIAIERTIVRLDPEGAILSRRRSPRHGDICDVFTELVGIAELLAHPHLEVEVVLVREEEYRIHSSDGPWRRKGWLVVERRLVEIVEAVNFHGGGDLARLLPPDLPEAFTTADLALQTGRSLRTAQQMAYCLRKVGAIDGVGKVGNTVTYRLVASDAYAP
jgi:hypothetical protein